MPASFLILIALAVFSSGYHFYGRFLTRKFKIDPGRKTPAHTKRDGIDYVPARSPVLFGHHFSSIAGAGPIFGPIFAVVFGWVPVFIWILFGSLFIGGVHDFSSMIASVRHSGKSIGEVIEEHIGKEGKRLFLIFAWFTLILVVAVFCKIVAKTFSDTPEAATSSILFIFLALLFGIFIYRLRAPLGLATIVGVILLFSCVALGILFPIHLSLNTWIYILLGYIFIAAVTPVWILLQPRDFLNSFLLYAVLIGGIVGIFVANPVISPDVALFRFQTDRGMLFPILFVTVACGAISGFHSLVASGTSSKQVNKETDVKIIGYGSMLVEGILAVVALITVIYVGASSKVTNPIEIFSSGIGSFMAKLGIPQSAGETFAALAVSAFCLTTLDTATRLSRFIFQEYFKKKEKSSVLSDNLYIGTVITILFAGLLAFSETSDTLWPLFGSANQLLAALALLAVTVWLAERKIKNCFVKIPMIFMFCVTLTALGHLIYMNFIMRKYPAILYMHLMAENYIVFIIAVLLFCIAIILVVQARKSLKDIRKGS